MHNQNLGFSRVLRVTVLRQLFWWSVLIVYPGVGSLSSSHWELMGDAMVTTEQVRLTPDMQSRQGAVWSRIVSIDPSLVFL